MQPTSIPLSSFSPVLRTLVSTDHVTDPYCTPLSILMMYLFCTDGVNDLHFTPSSILMLGLLRTEQPPPYCTPSLMLHIVYTGCNSNTQILPDSRSIRCAEHRRQICYLNFRRRFVNCPLIISKPGKCNSVGPKP